MPGREHRATCDLALNLIIHNENFLNERDELQTPRCWLHPEACFIVHRFKNSKIRSEIRNFENYIKAVFTCLWFFRLVALQLQLNSGPIPVHSRLIPNTNVTTWQATLGDRR